MENAVVRRKLISVVGATAVFTLGWLVAGWNQQRTPQEVLAPAVQPPNSTTNEARQSLAPRTGDAERWPRILLNRMSELEQRMEKLQTREDTAAESGNARVEPPSLTPEERIARNQARIQRIDSALEHEPHNGQWSYETTRVLQDLFVAVVPTGSTLNDTTCGETFCRLVVRHQNRRARDDFEIFSRKVPMGARGLIEELDDDAEQTTLYVVRKEYDTPEHPVRLQDSTG